VRVIARRTLRVFWEAGHDDAEQPLRAWYKEASAATWATPAAITAHYRSASILKNARVVFNIGGNKYRLIVAIRYDLGICFIRWIGTHADYDRIDAEEV
jgi:mRNA interferase HigB